MSEQHVELEDGTRIWTAVSGSGPTVVLLHGGPGMWDYLGPLAALLEDHHTVVRLEQRGCGRSTGADGPFDIATAVADVREVREALGIDTWAVVGHSWGAELSLWYAASEPERVRSVCYVAGVGHDDSFREAHRAAVLERLGERHGRWAEPREKLRRPPEEKEFCLLQWEPDFAPGPDVPRHLEEFWALRPAGAALNLRANRELWADRTTTDLRDRVAGLRAPVTMLFGAEDPRPWTAAEPLRAAIPVVADHVVVDGAGHEPWVEQPERVTDVLLRGLRA